MPKEKRRTYRERSQPFIRKKYGFLEKRKDYVRRARDFHRKKNLLLRLEEKAAFRNPDEFYFNMVSHKKKGGVFQLEQENKDYTQKDIMDMKTQDLNYIALKQSQENKKIQKMQDSLHLLHETPIEDIYNQHTIFVDDEEEVENFKPEEYFNTPQELLTRTFNRPKIESLENGSVIDTNNMSNKELKKIEINRKKKNMKNY